MTEKRTEIPKYKSRRTRGVVWVCDVAGSSRLLNKNASAQSTETFLERFLYFALVAVNTTDGIFIKWTGDGFLAFYEAPLDRDLGAIARRVMVTASLLSILVKATQLCCGSPEPIQIRHAITYEKDALLIDLVHSGDMKSKDVLGRNVVAAFRLSGMASNFPSIVTQREILRAIDEADLEPGHTFKPLSLTPKLRMKYFKGENYGSRDIYVLHEPFKGKARPLAMRTIDVNRSSDPGSEKKVPGFVYITNFRDLYDDGPKWCKEVLDAFSRDYLVPLVAMTGV
jgi:class 3 adenylate cyclase